MSALLKSVLDGSGPGLVLLQVDQFHRIRTAGILPPGAAIELIDGFMVPRERAVPNQEARTAALNARRAKIVENLKDVLTRVLSKSEFQVRSQLPLALGPLHEVTPDAAVIRGNIPTPEQQPQKVQVHVGLVVEVSDTTLQFDRAVKGRVYAMTGIPNYWIINLIDNTVESYSGPEPAQQKFAKGEIVSREGTLQMIIGDGEPVKLPVADFLPE